jgi:hypothetical protein
VIQQLFGAVNSIPGGSSGTAARPFRAKPTVRDLIVEM